VAIFPSDHYLSNDVVFMRHVDAAISAVSSLPVKNVLLGIPAVRLEHDYGWLELAEQLTQAGLGVEPIFRIGHLWETPHPHIAVDFWLRGLLWNSFVIVAEVGALLRFFARITPLLYSSFSEIMPLLNTPFENNGIARLYAGIPSENFI
jgi:mannose-1-phosphate guanylyltransferase